METGLASLPTWGLLLVAGLALAGAFAATHAAAAAIRNMTELHDLRVDVVRLHNEYLQRLRERYGVPSGECDVDILSDEEAAALEAQAEGFEEAEPAAAEAMTAAGREADQSPQRQAA